MKRPVCKVCKRALCAVCEACHESDCTLYALECCHVCGHAACEHCGCCHYPFCPVTCETVSDSCTWDHCDDELVSDHEQDPDEQRRLPGEAIVEEQPPLVSEAELIRIGMSGGRALIETPQKPTSRKDDGTLNLFEEQKSLF